MIAKGDLLCIGYSKRPHGFKGEIQIQLNKEIALHKGDFVFVAVDNQFIPYPVTSIKNQEDPIGKLRFVDDYDEAQAICGKEIYIESEAIPIELESTLIGYTLIDKNLGTLGKIKDIAHFPQQLMLVIMYNGKDCYVPHNDQFIKLIHHENKEIYSNLPSGLLDL